MHQRGQLVCPQRRLCGGDGSRGLRGGVDSNTFRGGWRAADSGTRTAVWLGPQHLCQADDEDQPSYLSVVCSDSVQALGRRTRDEDTRSPGCDSGRDGGVLATCKGVLKSWMRHLSGG